MTLLACQRLCPWVSLELLPTIIQPSFKIHEIYRPFAIRDERVGFLCTVTKAMPVPKVIIVGERFHHSQELAQRKGAVTLA